ncbi:hypothetical protein FD755_006703, partial [Muntiacus reevesi]
RADSSSRSQHSFLLSPDALPAAQHALEFHNFSENAGKIEVNTNLNKIQRNPLFSIRCVCSKNFPAPLVGKGDNLPRFTEVTGFRLPPRGASGTLAPSLLWLHLPLGPRGPLHPGRGKEGGPEKAQLFSQPSPPNPKPVIYWQNTASWSCSFQATVEEGAMGVIVNLTVEDKDDPTTGAWRAAYTIINGNPGQSFEIHTNPETNEGMLSVVKPLDYEISAFHTLLIKVENEDPLVPDVSYGPSSTATVHITVLDVNESPVFYPDPMMVTKQENISVGSVLLTVNATDPDSLQRQTI